MSLSASSSPSSVSSARSFTVKEPSTSFIIRERRIVIGSLMLTAIAALCWHSSQLAHVKDFHAPSSSSSRNLQQQQQHHDYMDIIKRSYNQTFAHLEYCPDTIHMDKCLSTTWKHRLHHDNVPW